MHIPKLRIICNTSIKALLILIYGSIRKPPTIGMFGLFVWIGHIVSLHVPHERGESFYVLSYMCLNYDRE